MSSSFNMYVNRSLISLMGSDSVLRLQLEFGLGEGQSEVSGKIGF